MKKFLFLSILITFTFFTKAEAALPTYQSIVHTDANSIIIRERQLEKSLYFQCSVTQLGCTTLGDKLPELTKATPTPPDKPIGETDYSFLTQSTQGHFIAFTNPGRLSTGKRTYQLWDFRNDRKFTKTVNLTYWDLIQEEGKIFAFSPDESKFVYLDDSLGHPMLYVVDTKTLNGTKLGGTRLTTKAYSINDFLFWDNDTLYFVANRDNPLTWGLYKYTFSTQTLKRVANNVSYAGLIKRAGDHLVFYQITNNGTEIATYNPATDTTRALKSITTKAPIAPRVSTGIFGSARGAFLKPATPAKAPRPLIVWLHGGPYRQTSAGYHSYQSYGVYDWMLNQLAESGAYVLKLDYHGSYGYGRPFADKIRGNVGKTDVQDVLAAVTAIKQQAPIGKVYLMGNSYGGYLALRAQVEKPASFSGAISINGVTDWETLLEKIPTSIFGIHFNGAPKISNKKLYNQASIVDRVSKLGKQKVLLFQSEDDSSVPFSQGSVVAEALVDAGKDVEAVTFTGENHVFEKTESVVEICHKILGFFSLDSPNKCRPS